MRRALSDEEVQAKRSVYDRLARVYDALADRSEQEARSEGLELLAVAAGESVLEIGFGTGRALVELAGSAGAGGRVAGVDVSPGMLEVARERLERAGLLRCVALHLAAVPPIPFDDGVFDALFMAFTLELFPSDVAPAVLAEVRRVLRPDGRLGLVALAGRPGEASGIERLYRWMHRHFPHFVDCAPLDDLEGLLAGAALEIGERRDLAIWGLPVAAVRARPRG